MSADNDSSYAHLRDNLFSAVIGDVMDEMGFVHQFLPPHIQPIRGQTVLLGRAMPVLEADCATTWVSSDQSSQPFGKMLHALDDLKPGEVYICNGSSANYALWGEMMTIRATKLGAAGAVLNGYFRDTRGVMQFDFPVFAMGSYAQDQRVRGRVIDYRCEILFANGVRVSPGDLVFADQDGVVIIPQSEEETILDAAYEKAKSENRVRAALIEGMSAVEAFNSFGVM